MTNMGHDCYRPSIGCCNTPCAWRTHVDTLHMSTHKAHYARVNKHAIYTYIWSKILLAMNNMLSGILFAMTNMSSRILFAVTNMSSQILPAMTHLLAQILSAVTNMLSQTLCAMTTMSSQTLCACAYVHKNTQNRECAPHTSIPNPCRARCRFLVQTDVAH